MTAGYRRACALGAAGDVRCWGESTPERPLGVGDPTRDSTFPARSVRSGPDAGALSGVGAVTTSRNTLCATGDAGVRCWGEVNELDAVAPWPAALASLPAGVRFFAAATGWGFACVAASDRVLCWGRNDRGQVDATGAAVTSAQPVALGLGAGVTVTALAAGAQHACAALSDGRVQCWGDDAFGQVDGAPTPLARGPTTALAGRGAIAELALGAEHTCALTTAGALWCWGRASDGALGAVTGDCRARDQGYARPMFRSAPAPVRW